MVLLPLLMGLTVLLEGPAWPVTPVPLAMSSPWWEDYDVKERFLCTDRGGVVVERNEAQAALINGDSVTTLFREAGEGPALVYRNGSLRLILRGDELTVERLPMTITCVRSEQV
ncbi:MAG: hypothetical protein ACK6BG_12295 [Cyanobacteriota bacterium]|jgi:hypothetical protein